MTKKSLSKGLETLIPKSGQVVEKPTSYAGAASLLEMAKRYLSEVEDKKK